MNWSRGTVFNVGSYLFLLAIHGYFVKRNSLHAGEKCGDTEEILLEPRLSLVIMTLSALHRQPQK